MLLRGSCFCSASLVPIGLISARDWLWRLTFLFRFEFWAPRPSWLRFLLSEEVESAIGSVDWYGEGELSRLKRMLRRGPHLFSVLAGVPPYWMPSRLGSNVYFGALELAPHK